MDDDDYYPPDRISHVVWSMMNNPEYPVCGSSELYLYFSDSKKVYKLGPYGLSHSTNGTMAYEQSYTKNIGMMRKCRMGRSRLSWMDLVCVCCSLTHSKRSCLLVTVKIHLISGCCVNMLVLRV